MNEHPPTVEGPRSSRVDDSPIDAGSQALSEALRSSFVIVKFVMVILVLVFLASGFFIVGPQERAIILRFGKPVGEGQEALLGPGLHWSFPYPIDEYVKVSISGIQRVTSSVGWYAITPEQELAGVEPPMGGSLTPGVEGYVVTGDGNILHARARMTYRIEDPIAYVFNFVNASNSIQSTLDNALLQVAARFKVDEILTSDVARFIESVRQRSIELIDQQQLGVVVEQFTVDRIPPRQLDNAFASVLTAEVNRKRVLIEARDHENRTLSRAGADAVSMNNAARSDRARAVADVSSRADQFLKLLPQYQENPSLFVQQRLADSLGRTLANVQDKIFVSENSSGNRREIRGLFNREPRLRTAEEPKR